MWVVLPIQFSRGSSLKSLQINLAHTNLNLAIACTVYASRICFWIAAILGSEKDDKLTPEGGWGLLADNQYPISSVGRCSGSSKCNVVPDAPNTTRACRSMSSKGG